MVVPTTTLLAEVLAVVVAVADLSLPGPAARAAAVVASPASPGAAAVAAVVVPAVDGALPRSALPSWQRPLKVWTVAAVDEGPSWSPP
jgi:hypothetical protein